MKGYLGDSGWRSMSDARFDEWLAECDAAKVLNQWTLTPNFKWIKPRKDWIVSPVEQAALSYLGQQWPERSWWKRLLNCARPKLWGSR